MQVIDTRQQFTDTDGGILIAGKLAFFDADAPTTPTAVYFDPQYQTSLGDTLTLESSGWLEYPVYADRSIIVHVLRSDLSSVKNFTVINTDAGSSSASVPTVESISALRVYDPVDGLSVALVGYYNAHDCEPVIATFDGACEDDDNLGTVILSSESSVGRWRIPYTDSRTFGVVSGPVNNANLNALFSYCSATGRSAVFLIGTYTVASAGTYTVSAPIVADANALIACASGLITITAQNPLSVFKGTFAGTGVKLVLNGKGWGDTVVSNVAWHPTERGYDDGTAVFRLRIATTEQLIFNNPCEFASIEVDKGVTAVIACDDVVSIGKITGIVDWSQSTNYPMVRDLVTSTATTSETAGELMRRCNGTITLDSPALLSVGGGIDAYINAIGLGSLDWPTDRGVNLFGGFGGKDRFIIGAGNINVNLSEVSGKYFNSYNIVKAFNNSPSSPAYLDLMGLSATGTITRDGKITNGTLVGAIINDNVLCEDLTITGYISSDNVKLFRVTVNHSGNAPVNGMTSSVFRDVVLTSTASTAMQAHFADWENVTYNQGIISVGGESHLRNVSCTKLTVRPDASGQFRNFTYDGGSIAENIVYDAANGAQAGTAIMYNTAIKGITGLATAAYGDVLNGPTRKWAINGNYNVDVSGNERGLSTRGTGVLPLTFIEADATQGAALFYILGYEKMLFLGPNSVTEFLTNCEIQGNAYKDGDLKRTYATGFIHAEMGRLSARQFYVGIKQNRIATTGAYAFVYPTHCSFTWRLYL